MDADTLAPTKEFLAKNRYEPPKTDQKTERKAGKYISLWVHESTGKKPALTPDQARAAEEFHVYYHGQQGRDVRRITGGTARDPLYSGRDACSDKLDHARSYVRDARIWQALELFCIEEKEFHFIGRLFRHNIVDKTSLRSAGITIVTLGLDSCANAWGIGQHARSRNRRAA